MRSILRRFAWLVSRLLVVLSLGFGVLSAATQTHNANERSDRIEELALPRYFNPAPVDLAVRVRRVVFELRHSENARANAELVQLGGAAIPVLMSLLGHESSETRARVAWALLPVFKRMGAVGNAEPVTGPAAHQLLERLWQERAADYQPTIVARWVQRLAQRGGSSLRSLVAEYDTFALAALMAELPTVTSAEDVAVAQRLLEVACRITGLNWSVASDTPPAVAASTVARWQRWWLLHSASYSVLRGPARWSAMLSETQFGKWVSLAVTFRFGNLRDGRSLFELVTDAGTRTLALLIGAAVGSWLAAFVPLLTQRFNRLRPGAAFAVTVAQVIASFPAIAIVALLASNRRGPPSLILGILGAAMAAALVDVGHHLSLLTSSSQLPKVEGRTSDPKQLRPKGLLFRALQRLHFTPHHFPFTLLLVFVVEKAFDVPGLAQLTVTAFRTHDLHGLMAVMTTTASWLLLVEFGVRTLRHLKSRDLLQARAQ